MRRTSITPEFVEWIPGPEEMAEGLLYISIKGSSTSHLCCCGCGAVVPAPISPEGWSLIYNGESASLYPSIGSWALPCQSHYWIEDDEVKWARQFSEGEIAAVRRRAGERVNVPRARRGPLPDMSEPLSPEQPDSVRAPGRRALVRWFGR